MPKKAQEFHSGAKIGNEAEPALWTTAMASFLADHLPRLPPSVTLSVTARRIHGRSLVERFIEARVEVPPLGAFLFRDSLHREYQRGDKRRVLNDELYNFAEGTHELVLGQTAYTSKGHASAPESVRCLARIAAEAFVTCWCYESRAFANYLQDARAAILAAQAESPAISTEGGA